MYGKRFGSDGSSDEMRSRSTESSSSGIFLSSNDASSASGSERSFSQHNRFRNDQRPDKDSHYIRSQLYRPGGNGPIHEHNNYNWRNASADKPFDGASVRGAKKPPRLNWSASTRRGMVALDNLTPHFCTQEAVDNLAPKFAQIEVTAQSTSAFSARVPSGPPNDRGRRRNDKMRNKGTDNWMTRLPWSIRHKFEEDLELTQEDLVHLSNPKAFKELLASPSSVKDVVSELHSKTARVQVEDREREIQVREHLLSEMKTLYPSCKVYAYGARPMGMAHPNCSVFSYFDAGNNYHGNPSYDKASQDKVRKAVFENIQNSTMCTDVRDWDLQEMVTYLHTGASLRCVVCVDSGIRHRNSLLIKMFLQLDDRVRPLMLLVTDLIYHYHDLSKYFTSYILQLMIIMYLQKLSEPVLPTLCHLRKTLPCDDVIIKGFDCSLPVDLSPVPTSKNKDTVPQLLYGFCTFYKSFCWEDDVVCILGPSLKRYMFKPNSQIPLPDDIEPPLSTYLQKLASDTHDVPYINLKLPIVVQDPFDLSHNNAEKMTSSVLQVFTMMCKEAEVLMDCWI